MFLRLVKLQLFFFFFWGGGGVLEIPDMFLGVNGRCRARSYVWRKKWEHPPPPPPHTHTGVYAHCSMVIPTRTWFMFNNVMMNLCVNSLTKPLRTRNEFLFNSLCHKRAKTAKRDVSAKHFSEFTQLFLVFICTCVIILTVTRFYLSYNGITSFVFIDTCISRRLIP